MKHAALSSGGILRIVFRHIKESPRTLAELYVYRDRTLVYKWLHDDATPPKGLVPGIVAFAMERSCEPVRLIIKSELDAYVAASGIDSEIAALLAATAPFQKFMEDLLHFAISLPSEPGPSRERAGRPEADPAAGAGSGGGWGNPSVPLAELGLALLALLGSGILWNGVNRLLGWTHYMGGIGREPRGTAAAAWGLALTLPAILIAMAARRRSGGQAPRGGRYGAIAIPPLYSLSGMVGALAFYDSGLRAQVEGLRLGYGLQELAIAFAFAALASLPPFAVIMAGWKAAKTRPLAALGYALLPPLLVSAAVSFTLLVDRPVAELEQLRGFLAGLMLRIGMYFAARGYGAKADAAMCAAKRPSIRRARTRLRHENAARVG
jgi:hypothetical protein